EIEAAGPAALRSACQVSPAARARLATWIDGRLAALGGSSEVQWRARGKDLDEVRELLTLERGRGLLAWAGQHAAADCPFWLNPTREFQGVHTSTDRLVFLAESRGSAALILRGDSLIVGGGGAGRLLPAY